MRTLTFRKAKWVSKGYPSIMQIWSTTTENQNWAIQTYKCMIFSFPGIASEARTVTVWKACPRGLTWRSKCCATLSLFFPTIQMGFLMLQNLHCILRAPVMGHSDCPSFVWVTCRSCVFFGHGVRWIWRETLVIFSTKLYDLGSVNLFKLQIHNL